MLISLTNSVRNFHKRGLVISDTEHYAIGVEAITPSSLMERVDVTNPTLLTSLPYLLLFGRTKDGNRRWRE